MKTLYKISQGNHSADGVNFGIHSNGAMVQKTVIFHPNCQYDLGNMNQLDINKLYGFSVGLFQSNQYNSARIGWRWSIPKQTIELLAYVYINGRRINEWDQDILLGEVNVSLNCFTSIVVEPAYYRYQFIHGITNKILYLPRSGSGSGYNQYPYFGGDEVAPHDMTIELK